HREELRALHEQTLAALDPVSREQLQGQLDAAQYASWFEWDHMAHRPAVRQPRWKRIVQQGIKAARAMWYWHTLPIAAARYAERYAPECRFFIFGHIHRAGIWHINN